MNRRLRSTGRSSRLGAAAVALMMAFMTVLGEALLGEPAAWTAGAGLFLQRLGLCDCTADSGGGPAGPSGAYDAQLEVLVAQDLEDVVEGHAARGGVVGGADRKGLLLGLAGGIFVFEVDREGAHSKLHHLYLSSIGSELRQHRR